MSAWPELEVCHIGRCRLTAGHSGRHWYGPIEPKPRKAWGSEPLNGTIDDVRALQQTVRREALRLAREGAKLP